MEFLRSAIVQTTITGLAAMTFSVYSHYKKRQLHAENLMRIAIFSEASTDELNGTILREMQRMDAGFGFVDALVKKETSKEEGKIGDY